MNINCHLEFDLFWEMYGKKVGRKDAIKAWDKIPASQFDLIFQHVPDYVKSTPDIVYRMHPATYLNGEHWYDQIIIKEKPKEEQPIYNEANEKIRQALKQHG